MRSLIKPFIFSAILISTFWFVVFPIGIVSAKESIEPSQEPSAQVYQNSIESTEPIFIPVQPQIIPTHSEPLEIIQTEELQEFVEAPEGKDLYIFYMQKIIDEYYPLVDPYIALAVLELESNYNPDVESACGAVGLMQVIPKYHQQRAEKYGLYDIWDPYTNIICGIDLLDELYQSSLDWSIALLGYNNSTSYVNAVLERADFLRGGNYFGKTASPNSGGS